MTKYRTKNDGYWDYLQYEKEVTKFHFWKRKEWSYILDAQFYHNRLADGFDFNRLINSYNHNLESWVKRYPNIEDWYKERDELIEENYLIRLEREERYNNNKNKIKYL